MFSRRVPRDLAVNRLSTHVAAARAEGRSLLDLTVSNPTRADFTYPADLLAPLADSRALCYAPQPLGDIEARRAVARDYERQGVRVPAHPAVLTASTREADSLLFK